MSADPEMREPGRRRRWSGRRRNQPGIGLRDLLNHAFENKSVLVLIVAVSVVASAGAIAQPFIVREVIDRVGREQALGAAPWVMGALLILGGVLSGLQQYLVQRTAEGVVLSTRRTLIGHLFRLPIVQVDRRRTADLVSRVTNDTGTIRTLLTQGFVDSVAGVLTLVGALVAMAFVDGVLLAVAFGSALVAVLLVSGVTRRIEAASRGLQEAVGGLSAAMDRGLRAVRTVRAANATEAEIARVERAGVRAWEQGLRVARITALIAPMSNVAIQVCFVAVLGVGGIRVASGDLTVADLVSFMLLLFTMIVPLGLIFGTLGSVGEALGGLSRIREILAVPAEDDDGDAVTAASVGSRPAIEFDAVTFAYDAGPGEEPTSRVLDAVSFRVEPGQRVAIVGPSGAGKSTVLSLLERFYDPSAGAIRLDGVDVRRIPRSDVRARLGYVEQDSPALAGTVRENLVLGRPGVSDAECRAALAAVDLAHVVARTPGGLDAPVGEGGVLLSGGERQRLAVARTLLARPGVVLLDESTSNLDGLSELRVREYLDVAARDSTLIVVAHRLATVLESDLIVVLDGGVVVASGTHTELLACSELYRSLAAQQLVVA